VLVTLHWPSVRQLEQIYHNHFEASISMDYLLRCFCNKSWSKTLVCWHHYRSKNDNFVVTVNPHPSTMVTFPELLPWRLSFVDRIQYLLSEKSYLVNNLWFLQDWCILDLNIRTDVCSDVRISNNCRELWYATNLV